MSFIQKRCIHDNFLNAQNVIRALHKFMCSSLFIKLDIWHAFDLISCPFLLEIMEALGFGQTWRNWTMTLLKTTSSKTLLNGIPGKTYRHSRCLRQGDPLSPMLFILVIDPLHNSWSSRRRKTTFIQFSQTQHACAALCILLYLQT